MSHYTTSRLRSRLADTLFIQTDAHDWGHARDCADRPGGGLVVTGGFTVLDAAEHHLSHHPYPRPLLVDRARYVGARRKLATEPFDQAWIDRQRRLELAAVLTDSGYVGPGDNDGLRQILTQTADWNNRVAEDVVAVLPLHRDWLNADNGLGMLVTEITNADVPIAVVLEHTSDPLGTAWAVDGLIQLLTVPVPVLILRCDIAAIGALAYGALGAAVGTTTRLRHLYPPAPPGGGFHRAPQTAAVVRPCLTYYSFDKISQIIQTDQDNAWWQCDCDECGGRRLDRIRANTDPDTTAFLHSLNTLYRIQEEIIGTTTTLAQRQQSWASQCSHALAVHQDIREVIPGWKTPPALRPWADRLTPPVREPDRGPTSPGTPVPPPPG